MTITVVMERSAKTQLWTARIKGAGVDLGPNMLTKKDQHTRDREAAEGLVNDFLRNTIGAKLPASAKIETRFVDSEKEAAD